MAGVGGTSTILLGPDVRTAILLEIFTSPYWSLYANLYGDAVTQIRLMAGTIPTNVDSLGGTTYRSSDILATWNVSNNTSWRSVNNQTITLLTPYTTATQSGTATWIWWISRRYMSSGATETYSRDMIMTVSGPGGGGEIIFAGGSNIVAGYSYRLNGISMTIPELYNY